MSGKQKKKMVIKVNGRRREVNTNCGEDSSLLVCESEEIKGIEERIKALRAEIQRLTIRKKELQLRSAKQKTIAKDGRTMSGQ